MERIKLKLNVQKLIQIEKPFFTLPSNMLLPMISTAEETLDSPFFPEELKPKTCEMLNDLIIELASRN